MTSQVFGPATQSRAHASFLLQQEGPVLDIRVSSPRRGQNELESFAPDQKVSALVDTGANVNGVDIDLAHRLGLPLVERRPLSGTNGRDVTPVYLGKLTIPALGYSVYGELFGLNLRKGGQSIGVLLGRRFLKDYTFTYDGNAGMFFIAKPIYLSPSDHI